MKRNKFTILSTTFIAITLTLISCTHNNGDIGDWFGTWKIVKIEKNETPEPEYAGNMFWKFQASVIEMQEVYELHSRADRYGSWERISPTTVNFNFTHSDNKTPAGTGKYAPLPNSHLPADIVALQIVESTSKNKTLRYRQSTEVEYTYFLRKQ